MNGTDPVENGVNGTDDVEMTEEVSDATSPSKHTRDKDGDEEMTVVVPPSKGPKLSGEPDPDKEEDVLMEGVESASPKKPEEQTVDPQAKAISGW